MRGERRGDFLPFAHKPRELLLRALPLPGRRPYPLAVPVEFRIAQRLPDLLQPPALPLQDPPVAGHLADGEGIVPVRAAAVVLGLSGLGEGTVRLITSDAPTTRRVLTEAALHHEEHTVLAVSLPHRPGELARLTRLLADAGVKLVGVDYISAEQFGAPAPLTHRILLGKGIPIVEGLDLSDAPAGDYDLVALPMKVRGHEGAPARAVLRRR